jgi:hypothetical protein
VIVNSRKGAVVVVVVAAAVVEVVSTSVMVAGMVAKVEAATPGVDGGDAGAAPHPAIRKPTASARILMPAPTVPPESSDVNSPIADWRLGAGDWAGDW